MQRFMLWSVLVTLLALLIFSCSVDNPTSPEISQASEISQSDQLPAPLAKKPAPSLTGTTEYDFVGHLGIFDAEGRLLAWKGTISGDIDGVIQWWMVLPMSYTGQVSHYEDRFEIWNAAETELLLAGDEAGSTTARHGKNSNWRTNGTVTEVGQGFEDWLGRQEHSKGHFTWAAPGLPDHGDGTFRIN